MKKTALYKLVFKEIWTSKVRFLSILILIVLGVGFFSGIQATGPNMLKTLNQYYDDKNLYDLHVQSTMGLEDEELELLGNDPEIDILEAGYSQDVLVGEDRLAFRLISYHEDKQLNQYILQAGRLPEKSGEIALDNSDAMNNRYQLGDQITLHPDRSDTDLDESFNETTFEVVGFVNSPRYFVKGSRGQTTIGGGKLDAFGVIREEDFDLPVYTDLFATFTGLKGLDTFSDAYQEGSRGYQSDVEEVLASYAPDRLDELKSEAEEEISDAEAEIADGRAELEDVREELAELREQLDDGKEAIQEARAELEDVSQELTQGESDYQAGLATFNDEIANAEEQLEQGRQELERQENELNQAYEELTAGEKALDQASVEIEKQREELLNSQADLLMLTELLADLLELPVEFIPDEEIEKILDQTRSIELEEGSLADLLEAYFSGVVSSKEINVALNQIEADFEAGLVELEQASAEIEAEREALESGRSELETGQSELAQARQLLDEQATLLVEEQEAGEKELAEARSELDQGWQAYQEGIDQLDEEEENLIAAEEEYQEGLEAFEEEEGDALEEIESAEEEIADARAELADLEEPTYYTFIREDESDFIEFDQNAKQLSELASVFPVVFFAVAALVTLTTITRMIEEQRGEIGILKALGYRNWEISIKYYVYATSASLLGTIIGLVLGYTSLPLIIFNAYGMMYELPMILLNNYWSYTLISASIALISTTVTAWYVLRGDLKSQAAVLMRPKAPKIGKRILLERISPIWSRLDFIKKVTARNLFRYKQRMFMTILGIAGCAALIIAGFGIKGAVEGLVSLQYGKVMDYNAMVILDDEASEEEQASYQTFIDDYDGIDQNLTIYQEQYEVKIEDGSTQDLNVIVPKDPDQLNDFIQLKDRTSDEYYQLSNGGAIVSEKIANLSQVEPGDTLTISDSDNQSYQIDIVAITENYTGHYLYLTEDTYRSVIDDELIYNADMLTFDQDQDWIDEFSKRLMEEDQVVTTTFIDSQIKSFEDSMASLNVVVVILILAAAGLAFVVLYNLTNINVSERIRELSTIKVLGFYDNEVTMYIYRENLILTLMGILLGGVFGRLLFTYVLSTIAMDIMMFSPNLAWTSYLYAFVLTFIFSTFVMWIMHHKLKRIDMIEALKSNE